MSDASPDDRFFPPTAWTVLLSACDASAPGTASAREELCRAYWRPVAAFLAALGLHEADAQDGAQEIMAQLFSRDGLQNIERERGRLRAYLKSAARHWLFKFRRAAQAQKRGGGSEPLALEAAEETSGSPAGDHTFDREWALTLCDRALRALEESYTLRGKAAIFASLKPALLLPDELQHSAAAGSLPDVKDSQIRLETHRLRRRLAARLRAEVAATLGPHTGTSEVEAETRYLVAILAHEHTP